MVKDLLDQASSAERAQDWPQLATLAAALRNAEPDRLQGWLWEIKALRLVGAFDQAEDMLAEAVRRFSDHYGVLEAGIDLAQARRDVAALELRCWQAIALHPRRTYAHERLIYCLREAGRRDEAQRRLDQVLALFPDAGGLWVEQAFLARDMSDEARFVKAWEECARLRPAQTRPVVEIANYFIDRGRSQEAHALLHQAMLRFGNVPELELVAVRLEKAGATPVAALARCAALYARMPDDVKVVTAYVELLNEQRDFVRSEAVLTAALQAHPTRQGLLELAARTADAAKSTGIAVQRWDAVRVGFPQSLSGYIGLATALAADGQPEKALDVATDALVRFPGDVRLLAAHARITGQTGRVEEALTLWRAFRNAYPRHYAGYTEAAALLKRCGRKVESEALIEEGVSAVPDAPQLLVESARTAAEARNWDTALARWSGLRHLRPDNGPAIVGCAEALIALSRIDEAVALLEPVLHRLPDNRPARFQMARADLQRGRSAEGLAALNTLAGEAPNDRIIKQELFEARMAMLFSEPSNGAATPTDAPRAELLKQAHDPAAAALMLSYESLGDNCEFGLVQRYYGVEPLGLLRWASIGPRELALALDNEFQGVGEPEFTEVSGTLSDAEYLTRDKRYQMTMHTWIDPRSIDIVLVRPKLIKRLQFLVRKMRNDLRDAEKIFIYKTTPQLTDGQIEILMDLLRRFGPNKMLFVREAGPEHPAGKTTLLAPDACIGYISHFGLVDGRWQIDFTGWQDICQKAAALLNHEVAV